MAGTSNSSGAARPAESLLYTQVDRQTIAAAEAQVSAEWQVGDVLLDLYEVTGVLGQGGMGKVYKVHHRGWNVDLAVKSPKPEIFATASGKDNFVREAETWVKLGLHPHIVSCYYVRTLGGIPRVFAEYVEGGSLSDWIRTKKPYEGGPEKALERILDIAIQFAWGLHYAHEQGLVHQDVKPANVMMTPDGVAKVTDFGLAKARGAAGEAQAAAAAAASGAAGTAAGGRSLLVSFGGMTPAYCSPEQARGEPLSRKTDIWSWGLSVLEMFTGEVTWLAGQAAPEALEALLETPPEDGSIPKIPDTVLVLLRRCFAGDPGARPEDLATAVQTLCACYAQATGGEYPRTFPKAAELSADNLNNVALSYLDLGRTKEAGAAWDAALKADNQHADSTFNRGVWLWRQGQLRDDELVTQLETLRSMRPSDAALMMMLAQVRMEQGDPKGAVALLEQASQAAGRAAAEIGTLMQSARSETLPGLRDAGSLPQEAGGEVAVHLDARGRFIFISRGQWGQKWTVRMWDFARREMVREFRTPDVPRSLSLSADGKFLLACAHGHLLLWEAATGRILFDREYDLRTEDAELTPRGDGALVVQFKKLTAFSFWKLGRYFVRKKREFPHDTELTSFAVSPDGRHVITGSTDGRLRLWEIASGRLLRTFEGHGGDATGLRGGIASLAFSADGRLALSGGRDETVRIWDVPSGRCLRVLVVGNRAPAADEEEAADLRGSDELLKRLRPVHALTQPLTSWIDRMEGQLTTEVSSVCLSPDGRWLLTGSTDSKMRLWEAETGRCLRTVPAHVPPEHWYWEKVRTYIAGDSRTAVSSGRDGAVRFWTLPDRAQAVCTWRVSRPKSYLELSEADRSALRLLGIGKRAAQEGHRQEAITALRSLCQQAGYERHAEAVAWWNAMSEVCRRSGLRGMWIARVVQGHTKPVTSAAWAAQGKAAVSGSGDRSVRVWDTAEWKCIRLLQAHEAKAISCVAMDEAGTYALSGGKEYSVLLWYVDRGLSFPLEWHYGSINALAVAPHGRWALSASEDRRIRAWAIERLRGVKTYKGHEADVLCLAIAPDARWFISGSADKTLRVWDVAGGAALRQLEGHADKVTAVALSGDGRIACSGCEDGGLRVWNLADGASRELTARHAAGVTSVCVSADGRFAFSAGKDQTLRGWDLDSGECRVTAPLPWRTNALSLHPDNNFLLCADDDANLRVWQLDWELDAAPVVEWDEGARGLLEVFLTSQTPFTAEMPPIEKLPPEQLRSRMKTIQWKIGTLMDETSNMFDEALESLCNPAAMVERLKNLDVTSMQDKERSQAIQRLLGRMQNVYYAEYEDDGIRAALERKGKPSWGEDDLNGLLKRLRWAGYGWILPDGVRRKLPEMAEQWPGPPPLPGS